MKNKHIQFSKRMTVVSVVAAILVTVATDFLLFHMGYPEGIVEVSKTMLIFASIVFAAYCGNSAVEKWALKRYGLSDEESQNG